MASGDADPLMLADSATAAPVNHRDWQAAFEFATGNYSPVSQTNHVELNDNARVSASVDYSSKLASDWQAVLANRVDAGWRSPSGQYNIVDTLKQAYLSWQPSQAVIVDAGRINLREGVAAGFNPTDFFKTNAIRSVVSIDPTSLRENRQGSVMLRSQLLWTGGSMSALVSPPLQHNPSDAPFDPDFGATNQNFRYMLSETQRLVGEFAPQWLLYGGAGIAPQVGVNLTTLLGDSTVGFIEYAGGRSGELADPAQPASFHSKLATGLTHTFPNKLSVTLEYDYDGTSADRATWDALDSDPARYWQYRNTAASTQALTTRQSLFLYASWQDALVRHLDLSAMARLDLVDHSYFTWLETRYHWPRIDLAFQWQTNHGASYSNYGAQTQSQVVQALMTFYY
ncbi:hypothetical protein LFL96_27380 [Paraburkholderia sp. D15]|uniref:hypothetical protein n=1 Tax=Paraburkholderia sp. D15 TaxID=2880218 RepID=UPI00247A936D|nr:hypothetical protein [Paraburkholderia sp. D15]WGS51932.1 hypothetical protein LFL96_27380 [Paraburkholderia sp. D15]